VYRVAARSPPWSDPMNRKFLRLWKVVHNRKNALFAGSDGGARYWAMAMTLIQTAKLNAVDPMAWLTDVLERVVSGHTKTQDLHTLLPWNWKTLQSTLDTQLAA
jgi:transposase